MESNYMLIVFLNLLFATDVSGVKKSKLEAKVDALDSIVRGEMYLLKETIETDRQERKELVKKLNQTLELLEMSTGERLDNIQVDTNNGGIQKQLNALSEKMEQNNKLISEKLEQNNKAISRLAESQIRTKRGFMEEKKARKADATATVTELIQIQKTLNDLTKTQQEIIKNQNNLVNTVTAIQNKIVTNHDDLANNINVIKTKTDALQNTTTDLRDKSDQLEQKLENELSMCVKTEDNTTQELVLQVSDIAQAVAPKLYCNNQMDLDACLHKHLESVRRILGSVRLVGGRNPYEGRVEVLYQDRCGTICDDGWDSNDAMVVCRMLGFTGGIAFQGPRASDGHNFGEGTEEILLESVACAGDELSLFQCKHIGIGVHNCDHSEDAGVRCNP